MGLDNQNPAPWRRGARYLPTQASIGVGSRWNVMDRSATTTGQLAGSQAALD